MMQLRIVIRSLFTVACLAPLALTGCGSSGSIEGTVSFRPTSKKLAWGNVVVFGRDNLPRAGMINKDGTYLVKDVPPGDIKICVSSDNPKPGAKAPLARPGSKGEERRAPPPEEAATTTPAVDEAILKGWFPIPAKYGDPTQTPLKHVVKAGKNTYDIVLE